MTAVAENVHSIQGEHFASSTPDIPDFEGNPVSATTAKVTSAGSLDIGDAVYKMDTIVRMVVEARIEGVGHDVTKDGKLIRVHRMKVIDSMNLPWELDLATLRNKLT